MNNDVQKLRRELDEVRRASVDATRQGDYRKVARLTVRAAEINSELARARSQAVGS